MHNKTRKISTKTIRSNKTTKFKEKTYNQDDYLSGDGMLTTVWGPSVWMFLHTMSFNYPVEPTEEDKKHYRDFVLSLIYVLPCKYCRMNLVKNFKQLPLTMSDMKNRETFSRYIYELHELVNRMLQKKSNLTYDDVRERYEHFRARCTLDLTEKKKVVKNKTRRTKERGCTEPLYGKKSKCVLKIVPQDNKTETFQMDKKCIKVK
jgi:Erv1 / Alr family